MNLLKARLPSHGAQMSLGCYFLCKKNKMKGIMILGHNELSRVKMFQLF